MSDDPIPPDYPPPSMPKVSLGTRFFARLIDAAVPFIPVLIVAYAVHPVVASVLGFAYFVAMESNNGATLGKRWLGLRVGQADAPGSNLTPAQAAKRNAFSLLSIIPTAIGSLLSLAAVVGVAATISGDPKGQGFHDKWAGALVSSTR